jgi:hypothetical protein
MAENHVSTRPPIARKPRRHRIYEGLVPRFLCHANSTHVLQTLWRGLVWSALLRYDWACIWHSYI